METEPSHIFDNMHLAMLFLADLHTGMVGSALAIVLLLLFSGVLSGSEVAYFSLGKNECKSLQEEESESSERILELLSKPRYLLSTILISNNVVNIALILVSDALISQLVPANGWGFNSPAADFWINGFITVGLVTFLLVLFGEVAPKVYAN